MATKEASVRSWRLAFSSLRRPSPPPASIDDLLMQCKTLALASHHVPPAEVAADIMLLMQVASSHSDSSTEYDSMKSNCDKICCLIMDISATADLHSIPAFGPSVLNFIEMLVQTRLSKETNKVSPQISYGTKMQKPSWDALQALGQIVHNYGDQLSLHDIIRSITLLLSLIKEPKLCRATVPNLSHDNGAGLVINDLETQRLIFVALTNLLSQPGRSIPSATYIEILKTLKAYLELIATKVRLVEDSKSSRFYAGVLRCLQIILLDMNGPIGEYVGPLVTCFLPFLSYGLYPNMLIACNTQNHERSNELERKEVSTSKSAYRPPHLRRAINMSTGKMQNGEETRWLMQSDSEQSDSDGSLGDGDRFKCSKVRALAVLCIQALARSDPKSLHALWTVLFPTNDILSNRRSQNSLLKTLIFDPILKVRVAVAATISLMFEGPSRAFMQIAEYRDSKKFGSFMTLSYSLGQVLLQIQRGFTHLTLNESNMGLLVAILKGFSLFIGAAPFSRLPAGMLPDTIQALQKRLKGLLSSVEDQTNATCMALNCIGCALSTVPPSDQVAALLLREIAGEENLLLQDLLNCTKSSQPSSVRIEALQALKLAVHNYPAVMIQHWITMSPLRAGILKTKIKQESMNDHQWGQSHNSDEKVVYTTVKLLNEFLRAASGSSLADDTHDELLQSSYTSVQSLSNVVAVDEDSPNNLKFSYWSESLQEYLPSLVAHSSPLVRAEAVTCFAGLTNAVFCTLPENERELVTSVVLDLAAKDESVSVRSAACRAIGVIISFPTLIARTDILISALDIIVHSTADTSIAVRITASWALANLCDALWMLSGKERLDCTAFALLRELAECAMRLAKDNDKVRANAVRALGNLARFIQFDGGNNDATRLSLYDVGPLNSQGGEKKQISETYPWLEKVVQTLVSCVTTGNVKVQWNVCHALGNLFLNKSIELSKMTWATSVFSILLLLLRDSKNFKIRIQAALALAVPETRSDYGGSYYDVVQALILALDGLDSNDVNAPAFKYVNALRNQLTRTCLHVLAMASPEDCQTLQEFLLKRASFLEGWLRSTYATVVGEDDIYPSPKYGNGEDYINLTADKIYNEKPAKERTWYAFSDEDPLVCKEEASIKNKEDMKCVAERLVNVYKDRNIVSFLEQVLVKCATS